MNELPRLGLPPAAPLVECRNCAHCVRNHTRAAWGIGICPVHDETRNIATPRRCIQFTPRVPS